MLKELGIGVICAQKHTSMGTPQGQGKTGQIDVGRVMSHMKYVVASLEQNVRPDGARGPGGRGDGYHVGTKRLQSLGHSFAGGRDACMRKNGAVELTQLIVGRSLQQFVVVDVPVADDENRLILQGEGTYGTFAPCGRPVDGAAKIEDDGQAIPGTNFVPTALVHLFDNHGKRGGSGENEDSNIW